MSAKRKAIIWSERATNEYLSTLDYILQDWGDVAAEKFENIIFHQVERITYNPAQFPLVNSKMAIRRCVATSQNSIFFREREKHIEILSVFDNRQSPARLKF